MPSMTRAQIQKVSQNLVDETQDKPGFTAPYLWDFYIDLICDELAALDGVYITLVQNIVANQQSYTYPQIQKIESVNALDIDGNPWPLEPITPAMLDQRISLWRQDTSSSLPRYAVMQGKTAILLYNIPNYNSTNGLIIEGFGVPGSAGANGASIWPGEDDVCPLPYNIHPAVAFGVAGMRCNQFKNESGAGWMAQYNKMTDQFLSEIQEASSATEFGDAPNTSLNMMGIYGMGGW